MKRILKFKKTEELLTDAQMLRDEAYAEMANATPDIKRVVDLRMQANKLEKKADRREVALMVPVCGAVGFGMAVITKVCVNVIKKLGK